jgi:hypothetical protein
VKGREWDTPHYDPPPMPPVQPPKGTEDRIAFRLSEVDRRMYDLTKEMRTANEILRKLDKKASILLYAVDIILAVLLVVYMKGGF